MIKPAILWEKAENNRVICNACARRCHIPEGSSGFCFIRKNIDGKLYLINYGVLASMQVDPIEKKPFNHFMPGSYVFGIGTTSCNFGCLFCQNHNISKEREITGAEATPEEIIDLALHNDTQGIAFTYNEPTIFIEYALDVGKLAHKKGLFNLFVTNGYMTKEAVSKLKGVIDAVAVDFKGNGEHVFANKFEAVLGSEPTKEALLELKKQGIHIEITDLIVPKVGDSLDACNDLTKWIYKNLGQDTPMQFTRFQPDYKMMDYSQTPYETLKAHHDIAKRNGLNYVYIGNVPGNPYESTYCPKCKELVIERYGFYIQDWRLDSENKCKRCGTQIFMAGKRPKKFVYREISSIY